MYVRLDRGRTTCDTIKFITKHADRDEPPLDNRVTAFKAGDDLRS